MLPTHQVVYLCTCVFVTRWCVLRTNWSAVVKKDRAHGSWNIYVVTKMLAWSMCICRCESETGFKLSAYVSLWLWCVDCFCTEIFFEHIIARCFLGCTICAVCGNPSCACECVCREMFVLPWAVNGATLDKFVILRMLALSVPAIWKVLCHQKEITKTYTYKANARASVKEHTDMHAFNAIQSPAAAASSSTINTTINVPRRHQTIVASVPSFTPNTHERREKSSNTNIHALWR